LAPGVDVRGDGGMIVAPPSKRRDGQYRWLNKHTIAQPPKWLLELVSKPKAKRTKLDRACAELAASAKGNRNDTLNRLAFRLGKMIRTGQLAEHTVRERLTEAALDAGLEESEIAATLDSALGAGKGDDAIVEINSSYALVLVGNKTAVMKESADGFSFMQ